MLTKGLRIQIALGAIVALMTAYLLAPPPAVLSFLNEPGDFRGMKWKANIEDFFGMQFIAADGDLKFYERKDENTKIGDATVSKIIYGFYRDGFYSVLVYFDGLLNYSKIKEIYIQNYGEAFQPNEYVNKYFWNGDNVDILLTYDDVMKHGRITYFYKPLASKMEEDEKKNAKRGAADL